MFYDACQFRAVQCLRWSPVMVPIKPRVSRYWTWHAIFAKWKDVSISTPPRMPPYFVACLRHPSENKTFDISFKLILYQNPLKNPSIQRMAFALVKQVLTQLPCVGRRWMKQTPQVQVAIYIYIYTTYKITYSPFLLGLYIYIYLYIYCTNRSHPFFREPDSQPLNFWSGTY